MASKTDSLLPPRWLLVTVSFILIVWLLFQLKELVVLLVLGYFLAYAIEPVLEYLERLKISRPIGLVLICFVAAMVISLLALTAIPTIVKQYDSLSSNLGQYVLLAKERIRPFWEDLRQHLPVSLHGNADPNAFFGSIPEIDSEMVKRVVSGIGSTLLHGYSITLTIVNLFLLPFIVFYLAIDFPAFHARLLGLIPLIHQAKVRLIAGEIDRDVSAYIRGQLLVCTILFCLYAIGLGLVGVDLWFLLAVIAGFGSMVPYLGLILGLTLSALMALATFGDVAHLLQVLVVFGVVQLLEATVITPKIIGEQVGLSPLVIILAIVACGTLFGLLGVLLAVPIAAVIRVLSRHYHQWLVASV